MELIEVTVGIKARDQIHFRAQPEVDGRIANFKLTGSGCPNLILALEKMRSELLLLCDNSELTRETLFLPDGDDHVSILFRELFLRAKGIWNPPYVQAELCHCRSIPTARVDQAIVCGSHTIQQIARETSAGTSCGTCRSDSESLIQYRLNARP